MEININKLGVARRQMNTAIELWFSGGDPISIHTLVAAACQILCDLLKKKNLPDFVYNNPSIRPERREVYAKAVRKSGGGRYPHRAGHNDPAAMIEIPRDALGPVTCGRSGLPLLATCSNWHRRLVPLVRHPIRAGLHAVLLQQECRLAGQSNRIEPRRSHHIFITQPASGRRATISSSGLSTPVD